MWTLISQRFCETNCIPPKEEGYMVSCHCDLTMKEDSQGLGIWVTVYQEKKMQKAYGNSWQLLL